MTVRLKVERQSIDRIGGMMVTTLRTWDNTGKGKGVINFIQWSRDIEISFVSVAQLRLLGFLPHQLGDLIVNLHSR